jgi:hypothetical protein
VVEVQTVHNHHPSNPSPRCQRCGDVIGVYERLVSVTADRIARETSRAAEPRVVSLAAASLYHLACYQAHEGA